jgi:hypothetical protein
MNSPNTSAPVEAKTGAGPSGGVGQAIVVCGLPRWQTTKNDRLPHVWIEKLRTI